MAANYFAVLPLLIYMKYLFKCATSMQYKNQKYITTLFTTLKIQVHFVIEFKNIYIYI